MIVVKQPKNMYLKYNIKIQFCGDLEPKMVNDIRFQKYVRRRRFFSGSRLKTPSEKCLDVVRMVKSPHNS